MRGLAPRHTTIRYHVNHRNRFARACRLFQILLCLLFLILVTCYDIVKVDPIAILPMPLGVDVKPPEPVSWIVEPIIFVIVLVMDKGQLFLWLLMLTKCA
jgi:hypothetical protein